MSIIIAGIVLIVSIAICRAFHVHEVKQARKMSDEELTKYVDIDNSFGDSSSIYRDEIERRAVYRARINRIVEEVKYD